MNQNFARLRTPVFGVIALVALLLLIVVGYWQYMEQIGNPRIARELLAEPDGERAMRVMLLELPSSRRIPVNYLREQNKVYAAADGGWWAELTERQHPVELLIRGQSLHGTAQAIRDDPERTQAIFLRLRPNALEGFGTLIEITLESKQPRRTEAGQEQIP